MECVQRCLDSSVAVLKVFRIHPHTVQSICWVYNKSTTFEDFYGTKNCLVQISLIFDYFLTYFLWLC